MAQQGTLEQLQTEREKAIEANRDQGVITWKNDLEQSEEVWEVVDGYHRVPDRPYREEDKPEMIRLGPGERFHPTIDQAAKAREKGGLLRGGHIRQLTSTEMAGIGRSQDPSRKPWSPGADIGIRALPMSDTALVTALKGGLKEEDFESVEPERSDGHYTVAQVEAMVAEKAQGDAA